MSLSGVVTSYGIARHATMDPGCVVVGQEGCGEGLVVIDGGPEALTAGLVRHAGWTLLERVSTRWTSPNACSGGMYAGVPVTEPSRVP